MTQNVWHHAAATYDGSDLKVYLDGNWMAEIVDFPANSVNIAHVGLGDLLGTGGVRQPNGFFGGCMDEARIWNMARTEGQIQASMNTPITSPTAGLLARYGLNEGTGTASVTASRQPRTARRNRRPTLRPGRPARLRSTVTLRLPPRRLALPRPPAKATSPSNWNDNGEGDLAGYNVYRGTSSPVSTAGSPLNGGSPLVASQYNDPTGTPGTTYFYVVTAEDTSGNESGASNEVSDSPDPFAQAALQFDGTNDHVTLGSAAGLSATNFTLEAWIKRTGPAPSCPRAPVALTAVPLITKGRHDNDGDHRGHELLPRARRGGSHRRRLRGLRGLEQQPPVHRADGRRHRTCGTTWRPPTTATSWRLFLDGVQDGRASPAVNATPRFDSTEHAAIATSLDDAAVEVPEGFFQGQMDEVRIWNVARTPAQIAAAYQLEIPSATGLLGRYSMNEGLGTAVGDSSGTPQNGTAVGGPTWVQGYTFQVGTPNDPPVVDSVAINQASPHTNDTLSVTVTSHDPNSDPVNYSYQWSRNNVDISGATGATLNMATAGNGGKGDAIRVRVVANDGLDDSAPVTSSPVTVLNTIPVASVSIDDTTPGSNDVITATATDSDLDGDTVTLTYVWRVNNVVRQTTSNSSSLTDTFDLSLANHGNTSDEVTVTVTPNDGEQNGNAATSATATVQDASSEPNRLPELTWQTNDRVKDILRVGNTVYIAGNFTQIRSNNGAQTMTRNRLAAFDALTGNPLPWNPNANGNVEAITASPDGSIIYAGGVFKKMGGSRTSGSRRSMPRPVPPSSGTRSWTEP